jgi:hypothetical protein
MSAPIVIFFGVCVRAPTMKFHYYKETDSLYINLSGRKSADSKEVGRGLSSISMRRVRWARNLLSGILLLVLEVAV